MIIPSIDLMDGRAVQLRQGKTRVIDAGDPRPLARLFGRVGEVAVIDLDAAMGRGSNTELIRELLPLARCRVGGGIRDASSARGWLDAGASKVILGTRAVPEVLEQLPRERVIAAVDARDGEVVVEGWTRTTSESLLDRVRLLAPFVGGFLVTFVEIEGMLAGLGTERVLPVIEAAGGVRVTVAGGVRTADEVGCIDRAGADAQVGMAIYQGLFRVSDAVASCMNSDRADGLWPTVVVDEGGRALGLCFSNAQSLDAAIQEGRGVYWSRRHGLWRKGETSEATQELLRVDLDCDRDALRFTVRQHGTGFCHQGSQTCWGDHDGLARLVRTLEARRDSPPDGSYSARVLSDPALLAAKIVEEAAELVSARSSDEVIHEAADVLYFTLARLAADGIRLADVERELDRRAGRVTRRPGDAKPGVRTSDGDVRS